MGATEEQFVKVSASLIRSSLSDRAFRLFAEMRTYAWESTGSPCTASQARLANDLGWSIDKVRRAARELEEAGCLTNVRESGKPNTYQLTPSRTAGVPLAKLPGEVPQNCHGYP